MMPSRKTACSLLSPWMKKNEGCHYKNGWLYAGNVAVDSGTISIHDPNNQTLCNDEKRIQSFSDTSLDLFGNMGNVFVSRTYMGDDVFPVYVKLEGKNKPSVMQVLVDYSMEPKYFGFLKKMDDKT
jgi:hypothetical protein